MALGEKSFFWDKPSGDLTEDELAYYQYAAQDLASFFECLYTTGIAPEMAVSSTDDNPEDYIGSSLAVTTGSGLQIIVSPGVAMIKGRGYISSLPIQLTVTAGETTDIVLRMDLQSEKPEIYVAAKQREGSASLENSLSHESLNYELALATVVVPEKATAVTASMITDQRLNTNKHPTDGEPLAGLMKSIPGVDTKGIWEDYTNLRSSMNSQWDSFIKNSSEDFDEWFETAQSVIGEDAAGELLNLIYEIKSSKNQPNGFAGLDVNGDLVQMPTAQDVGACNPNLLKNWYFGVPTNTQGKTKYTSNGYTIDHWKLDSDRSGQYIQLENNEGLTLNGGTGGTYTKFEQVMDYLPRDTYTLSFWVANPGNVDQVYCTGVAVARNQGGNLYKCTFKLSADRSGTILGIQAKEGKSVTISAAKLEAGNVSTLGNQSFIPSDVGSVNGFTFAVADKKPTSAPAGRITFVYEE